MNQYVISYVNFYNNDLKMEIVRANSQIEALNNSENIGIGWIKEHINYMKEENTEPTIENLKEEAFNQDFMFGIIEVPFCIPMAC